MKSQKTLRVVAMLVTGLLMFSFFLIEDVCGDDQDQTQDQTQDRLKLHDEDCDCICTCCQDCPCPCCTICPCPCCQDNLIEAESCGDQDQIQDQIQDRLQLHFEDLLYEFGEDLMIFWSEDCDYLCPCCWDDF